MSLRDKILEILAHAKLVKKEPIPKPEPLTPIPEPIPVPKPIKPPEVDR